MAESGKVLVLLGGESTGKSSLAQALHQTLQGEGHDAVVVPECLRLFCETHGRTPRADEQPAIADAQTQAIAQAAGKHAIVIADTGALMTAVYSARLFGDVHDPASVVSVAIRDRGGYPLMPEWNTRPANHYLPRRRTDARLHDEDLVRVDNPLRIDGAQPEPPCGPGHEDFAT